MAIDDDGVEYVANSDFYDAGYLLAHPGLPKDWQDYFAFGAQLSAPKFVVPDLRPHLARVAEVKTLNEMWAEGDSNE